jgi:hypothetical protein
MIFKIFL